jgi:hypothetical protein
MEVEDKSRRHSLHCSGEERSGCNCEDDRPFLILTFRLQQPGSGFQLNILHFPPNSSTSFQQLRMVRIPLPALAALSVFTGTLAQADLPGVASFVAPSAFPTSVFSSYYAKPAPTSEPQPAIHDAVLNITYPLNLTDPKTIPTADNDPVYYPPEIDGLTNVTSEALVQLALTEIKRIISDVGGLSGNCSKCIAVLSVGKFLARAAPSYVPDAMISLCQSTGFSSNSTCASTYAAGSYGAIWTQVLALADVTRLDGQYICSTLSTAFCSVPTTTPLNTTSLFPKPKPKNVTAPKASGKLVKVLHLSDFHLDPRYSVASEANCSSGLCCRYSTTAPTSQAIFPAPLYGAYR